MTELTPSPADLASLLIQMTQLEWPTTERDRLGYFESLGLHDLDELPRPKNEPDSDMRRFTTSLPGPVDGICTIFRKEFLGLSLFCYNEPTDNGPQARTGYAALHDHLSRHLGPPVEEWGTPTEPACLWRPGPLMVDMYCFQRHSSGIMIGPSHAERSAANEAAHKAIRPSPQDLKSNTIPGWGRSLSTAAIPYDRSDGR